MNIQYGEGKTQYGTGVLIELTGDELANAIVAWLVSQNIRIDGARTISVNGGLCANGQVYVDPSGRVTDINGIVWSGRGGQ